MQHFNIIENQYVDGNGWQLEEGNSCHFRYLLSYSCDRLSICEDALKNSICYLKSRTALCEQLYSLQEAGGQRWSACKDVQVSP